MEIKGILGVRPLTPVGIIQLEQVSTERIYTVKQILLLLVLMGFIAVLFKGSAAASDFLFLGTILFSRRTGSTNTTTESTPSLNLQDPLTELITTSVE